LKDHTHLSFFLFSSQFTGGVCGVVQKSFGEEKEEENLLLMLQKGGAFRKKGASVVLLVL
jgi:hypothetical protein